MYRSHTWDTRVTDDGGVDEKCPKAGTPEKPKTTMTPPSHRKVNSVIVSLQNLVQFKFDIHNIICTMYTKCAIYQYLRRERNAHDVKPSGTSR